MYLIFFDPSRLIVDIPKVSGLNLKAFNGSMVISGQELKHIKETARYIWRSILNKTGLDSFRGLIRFDLAPQFNGEKKLIRWQNLPVFDIGELSIAGIYEINTHSPECMAAIAALHYASPIHSWHQPNIGERLAQIIEKRVGQDIIFIPGDNPIKQAWGQYLIISLKAAGLNVVQGKMEDLLQQEKISLPIWRWGDARLGKGPSEYPLSFQHWLLKQPLVFNSLPKTQDPGDKSLLADKGTGYWNNLVGENFILSPQTAQQALKRQKDLVLKPLKGSSGNGLIFGPLVSAQEWKQAIEKITQHQQTIYGAFEIRWLPKIDLPEETITLDLNVAFWAEGESLTYLYSVSRLDYWGRYQNHGVLNVSQGAGFTGTIVDND